MMKLFKRLSICLLLVGFAISCAEQEPQQEIGEDEITETTMGQESDDNKRAIAVIHPTEGNDASGTVTFEQTGDSVHVTAEISGLEQGQHGFHVHEYGDCSASDATSAGGHYNPGDNEHGAPDDEERHVGDMGNIEAGSDEASRDYFDSVIELNGSNSIIGHAVVIHEGEDDLQSQPTGDAGSRLGCGVIGVAEADTTGQM